MIGFGKVDYAGRKLDLSLDGTADGSVTGAFTSGGSTSNFTSTVALISSTAGNAPWRGEIAAVMAGVALPTTTEIHRLAGWAAWERGLQSNLPSDHPYKTTPP